jgi:hypothetical protein
MPGSCTTIVPIIARVTERNDCGTRCPLTTADSTKLVRMQNRSESGRVREINCQYGTGDENSPIWTCTWTTVSVQ